MATVYRIVNLVTGKMYIGITRRKLSVRWSSHIWASKTKNTYLYCAMRKYKIENFKIEPIVYCDWNYACWLEKELIAGIPNLYNLAQGGEGGYVIPEWQKPAWKAKLSKARKGRKPALGMKHTEENKRFFSECSKRRVLLYPMNIVDIPFAEAKIQYGISKTHYYRLLKRAKTNDLG